MIWGITMAVLAACEQPEATSSTPQLNISATNLTTNAPLAFHDNCLDSVSKGENIVFQIEIRSPYNHLLDFQIQYDTTLSQVALEDEYELNSAIASQGEGIIRFADDIYHATVSFQYLIKEAGVSPQLTFIIRTQNEDGGVSSLTKSITTPAIPEPEPEPPTELDLWIDSTFCYPYNIKVTYKQQAGTEEYDEETLPPHEDLVQPFLKAVLKIWGKPYMETSGKGNEFLQEYAFRELKLVGNGGRYNSLVSLGIAEGGYKMTLYTVNDFNFEAGASQNDLQVLFQSMHHEFGHVLRQRKNIDAPFGFDDYVANWASYTDAQALEKGFLSAYSMASSLEDFSEILSHYICRTPAEWEELLAPLNVPEGHEKHDQYEESKRKINEKQQAVSLYMQNAWNINIDDLRAAVTQGIDEAANGNLD